MTAACGDDDGRFNDANSVTLTNHSRPNTRGQGKSLDLVDLLFPLSERRSDERKNS